MTADADLAAFAAEPDMADVCALPLVRRVAALLDQDAGAWQAGMPLPCGWEFILFTPATPQSSLGRDGHHLPPPTFGEGLTAKVMLGGRRFRFFAPIPIGAGVRRSGEVVSVQRKQGRAGALVLVTRRYRTTLVDDGALAVEEEEDMVYRAVEAGTARAAGGAAMTAPSEPLPADAERPYRPDESMLFRYSSLCNNAHRIHYDLPFAQEVEGYPALVVNGGLTGLMLVELFRAHVGRDPVSIATRMLRPLFCGTSNRVRIIAEGDHYRCWAENEAGETVAEAIIT